MAKQDEVLARNAKQKERLDLMMGFLETRGLVDDFNTWCDLKRAAENG